MVRLKRALKGFVLAGTLLLGCLPGVAQAKWIKATVTGNYTGGMPDGISLNDAITLNFIIQNYSGTPASGGAPNYWDQYQVKPNYTQLFGYGTGTNSTGLNGFYNASQNPGGSAGDTAGNLIESQNDGKEFLIRLSGSPTGLSFTRGGTSKDVINMSIIGNLVGFSSSIPLSGSTDVVDFLSASMSASIETKACSTTPDIGSPTNIACTGQIQATAESPITFTWTNITFDQIEAVPGPLPVAGALVAFRYSRKIRSRIKR
jgi:hypothetical protein